MIGILVVSHLDFATPMISAAERVLGPQQKLHGLNLHRNDHSDEMVRNISEAIHQCCSETACEAVVILTDLYGSTPTNACIKQKSLHSIRVEVITGVNLNMLLSALAYRERLPFDDLIKKIVTDAQKGIRIAQYKESI